MKTTIFKTILVFISFLSNTSFAENCSWLDTRINGHTDHILSEAKNFTAVNLDRNAVKNALQDTVSEYRKDKRPLAENDNFHRELLMKVTEILGIKFPGYDGCTDAGPTKTDGRYIYCKVGEKFVNVQIEYSSKKLDVWLNTRRKIDFEIDSARFRLELRKSSIVDNRAYVVAPGKKPVEVFQIEDRELLKQHLLGEYFEQNPNSQCKDKSKSSGLRPAATSGDDEEEQAILPVTT